MRGIKITREQKDKFIRVLRKCGNATFAAASTGMSIRAFYYAREADSGFSEEWEDARAWYLAKLEAEIDRRARRGILKPVFYQGEQCGTIREFSDNLLMFRTKAEAPEKYRERSSVDLNGDLRMSLKEMSEEELHGHLQQLVQSEAVRAALPALGGDGPANKDS